MYGVSGADMATILALPHNRPSQPNEKQEDNMNKTIFLVALCTAFLLASAIQVSSAPPGLRLAGTYYLQGTETCVYTEFKYPPQGAYSGFDNTFSLQEDATTRSFHQEGKLVLDRDGTGYVEFSSMLIFINCWFSFFFSIFILSGVF